MRLQKFQVSDETFWGYQITLDLDIIFNTKDIIEILKEDMINYFKKKNLQFLIDKINVIHLNVPDINKIKNCEVTEIVYICSHEHNCSCCN